MRHSLRRNRPSAARSSIRSSAPAMRRKPTHSICHRPIQPIASGACCWRSIPPRAAGKWRKPIGPPPNAMAISSRPRTTPGTARTRYPPPPLAPWATTSNSASPSMRDVSIWPGFPAAPGSPPASRLAAPTSPGSSRRAPAFPTACHVIPRSFRSSGRPAPRTSTTSRCACWIASCRRRTTWPSSTGATRFRPSTSRSKPSSGWSFSRCGPDDGPATRRSSTNCSRSGVRRSRPPAT